MRKRIMLMRRESWRSKRFAVILSAVVLIPASLLLALRIDFGIREQARQDAVLEYFSKQEGMHAGQVASLRSLRIHEAHARHFLTTRRKKED